MSLQASCNYSLMIEKGFSSVSFNSDESKSTFGLSYHVEPEQFLKLPLCPLEMIYTVVCAYYLA